MNRLALVLILSMCLAALAGCLNEYRCVRGQVYVRDKTGDGLWHKEQRGGGTCTDEAELKP